MAWDYPSHGEATYGLQPVFVNLSREQARQGYEVHVVAPRKNHAELAEEVDQGVQIHRVSSPFSVNGLRKVRTLISHDNGWVVHTHGTCGFFLFPFQRLKSFPMVSQIHGTTLQRFPMRMSGDRAVASSTIYESSVRAIRERLLWSSADRILTVSKSTAEEVQTFYDIPPNLVRTVYNGVDTTLFSPTSAHNTPKAVENLVGKRVVLYVGHFGLRKGIRHLVQAMKLVKNEVPDAHLLCIGGAPKWLGSGDYWRVIRNEIAASNLISSVTLMDAVKNMELPQYYRIATIFVLPSYYESFSKVTLEAMACGKPVIATDAGGLPEMVENEVSGLLVPYGSVSKLASAILELLNDEDRASEMGRRARKRVEKMFTWTAVSNRISEVYGEFP